MSGSALNNLYVYSASAGSGKTYTIAYEYISMMLKSLTGNESSYRNILAVTFTNKACDEMKSRIVRNLFQISNVDSMPEGKKKDDVEGIIAKIDKRTELGRTEIIRRSAIFFKSIIHDYSFFSVFTIDSFFQKIVRNLTYELGMQQNYELELHTDLVISQLVDDLMLRAEDDAVLSGYIGALIDVNIDDGKKWSPKKLMVNFIKQAIASDFKAIGCNIDDYEKDKDAIIIDFSSNFQNCIEEICGLIASLDLQESDFYGGNSGNYSKLKKFKDLDFSSQKSIDILLGSYSQGTFKSDKWFTKKSQFIGLSDKFNNIVAKISDDEYRRFCTACVIKKNINLLRLVDKSIEVLRENLDRDSLFLLSDVPSILSGIIGVNKDVMPFIFEKVGTTYSNYMIDEFQDTSRTQWNIFRTMLHEALSQGNDSIIVGDKKQSIYSWRGGDWRILSDIAKDDVLSPYVKNENLSENYRTAENIVKFNNDFFMREYPSEARDFLKNAGLFGEATLYDDVVQKIKKEDNSEVKVSLYDGEMSETDAIVRKRIFDDMLAEIEDLQLNHNVVPGQITILVCNGDEASFLASSFLGISQDDRKRGVCYDVVSNEALFIRANPAVRLIIAYMRYMLNPKDELSLIEAAYLYNLEKEPMAGAKSFNKEQLKNDLLGALGNDLSDMQSFEIVETLVARLGLNRKDNVPFLIAFRNIVHDFSDKSTDLQAFLEYWDERGANETLKIPESNNAMRIITIYKSKGLEADYVFVPFCNWKLVEGSHGESEYIFYNDTYCGQDIRVPVENSKLLLKTEMADKYNEIRYRKSIESYNLMYVAFTRAKFGLYVYAYDKIVKKASEISKVSQLLRDYFENIGNNPISWIPDVKDKSSVNTCVPEEDSVEKEKSKIGVKIYRFGNKPITNNVSFASDFISEYPVSENPSVKIVHHLYEDLEGDFSARARGTRYHSVFEHIETIDDVESSVDALFDNGEIDAQQRDELVKEIRAMLSDDRLSRLYDGSGKVYNEFNIIDPNSDGDKLKRPDRVVEFADEVVVLDYKFGEEKNMKKYSDQVCDYMRLISEMEAFKGKKISAYIWYYFRNELVKIESEGEISLTRLKD